MLNNFIYAQTKDLFLEQLNAGNILDEAIVFIEDTKEIWNHGHYFGGGDNEQVANIISQISQITITLDTKATKSELSDYAKTSAIPTKVSQLTNDSNYLTQTQADGLYIALSQLESINNSISQLNTAVDKKLDAETASTTYALKVDLANKQDEISDLDDIRSNAEKGATAVQPDDLTNINEALNAHNTAITNLQNVGAEANVQSDWNATTGDAFILNKPDLSVYLKSSDAENIYATQTTVSDLDTKVGGIETAFDNYKTSVSETYLTKNDASTTYAKSDASYTKQESDDKYLTSDALTPYATDQELSALSTTVTTLSGTVSTNTENIGKVSDRVEVIEDYFDGVADADNALNKWHEIVDFLDEIDDTSNLSEILKGKANQTALDSTNAEVATIKDWGNHAKAGYQAAIDDLGTIRTNASNGAIAYGWGNHADAKYATTDNLNALSTTVANLKTSSVEEDTNLYFTNARARTAITGGASTIAGDNLAASRALVSNANGKVIVSDITSTELGYLDGVSSNIQTQLDGKAPASLSTTVDAIAAHFSAGKFSIDGYVSEKMITRTSVNAIPITAGSCKCTISANATFGFASVPEAGRNIYVLIYNSGSSTVTVTLPNTGSYKSFSGTSLAIPASGYAEISAFSDGTTIFLRAGM